ncbi:MAG: RHS repeat-associated core domain-containing protein [Spirochaetota bacterium]
MTAPILSLQYASILADATDVLSFTATTTVSKTAVANFPTSSFTISLWLKPSSTIGNILMYSDPSGSSGPIFGIKNPGNLEVSFGSASTGPTQINLKDGFWHQLAITVFTSNTNHYAVSVYKDGVNCYTSIGSLSFTPPGIQANGNLVLGGGDTPYTGLMSEFRLWDSLRSQQQIATNIQRRMQTTTPGIVIWWGLSSNADSGTVSNGSFVSSGLRFREKPNGQTAYLLASWNQTSQTDTYDLQVLALDGSLFIDEAGLDFSQQPYPIQPCLFEKEYRGRVRSVTGSTAGDWSQIVTVVPIDLAITTIVSTWNSSNSSLSATWQSIDQAQSYQVYINNAKHGNPITETSFDLTPYLSQTGATTLQVDGLSMNSVGVLSDISPVAQVTGLKAIYNAPEEVLVVNFADGLAGCAYYLQIIKDSDTTVFYSQWVSPGGSPYTISIPAATITLQQSYTVQVRAIHKGSISDWSSVKLTPSNLAGPLLNDLSQNTANKSITATWTFSGATAESYNIVLTEDSTPNPPIQETSTSKTFTGLTEGTTYKIKVQAVTATLISQWSQEKSIVLGSNLAQVSGLNVTSDKAGNLNANWNIVTGNNVSYELEIYDSSGFKFPKSNINGTTISLPQTETNVTPGNTYNVHVRANAPNSLPGDWSLPYSIKAGEQTPSDPGSDDSDKKGDPVLVSNGAYVYSFTAIEVFGVVPIRFTCFYSSLFPLPSDTPSRPDKPLGARWNHSYNIRIEKSHDGQSVYILWGNGLVNVYNVPASISGYYSKKGLPNGDALFVDGSLNYTLTQADQTVYQFNPSGVLQKISSPQGNDIDFSYTNERLTAITDTISGRRLNLTYYTSGADDGRIHTISTASATNVSFTYQNSNLMTFIDVNGNDLQFTYHHNSLMETTTDTKGNVFITNTYDSNNRVQTQKDARATANGENYAISFSYQDITFAGIAAIKTTVVDRMGNSSYSINDKAINSTLYSRAQIDASGTIAVTRKSYDANARLVAETYYEGPPISENETKGNTTRYEYNGVGLTTKITYANGTFLSMEYDERNNKTAHTDIYGNQTSYEYYSNNTLKKVIDAEGRETIYTYKAGGFAGELETIQDVLSNIWHYQYYSSGEIQTITTPAGNNTTYTYDTQGRQTSQVIRNSDGTLVYQASLTLDPKSGLIQTQKVQFDDQEVANAFVTTYTYDELGLIKTITDTANNTTTYHFDPNNLIENVTFQAVNNISDQIVYSYNKEDHLILESYTDNQAHATPVYTNAYGYDNIGRLTSKTDGNAKIKRFSYSMEGLTGSGPYNTQITTTYPAVTVPDGAGSTKTETYSTTASYDPIGRLVGRTYPAIVGTNGAATSFAYNVLTPSPEAPARLEVLTTFPKEEPSQANAYSKSIRYDRLFRVTEEKNENEKIWQTRYSTQHNSLSNRSEAIKTTTDPTERVRIYRYDSQNNLVSTSLGGNSLTARTVTYSSDALGRPLTTTQYKDDQTLHTNTSYSFDTNLKASKVSVTAYGAAQSTLYYDGQGRLVQETFANNNSYSLTYNERNQLKSYTNGRKQSVTYAYDHAGRFTTTLLPGGDTVLQELDGNGNRLFTKLNGTVTISRKFDELNRMTSRTDSFNNKVGYSYYPEGMTQQLTYPDGKTVDYTYNGLLRMQTVTDWKQRVTNYTYHPQGKLATANLPGGLTVNYGFDAVNRLNSLQAKVGSDIIASTDYTFNEYGQIQNADEVLPLATNRIETAKTLTYTGNMLDKSGTESAVYDDDGNMTTVPGINGTLSYNVFNQLESSATGQNTYTYDEDGLRLATSIQGNKTRYVQNPCNYFSPWVDQADLPVDPSHIHEGSSTAGIEFLTWARGKSGEHPALNQVLATTDDSNAVTARYVYGQGLISQELANGDHSTYIFDARGSTLALLDEEGNTNDRYAYSQYGDLQQKVGNTVNPFTYAGQTGVIDDGNGLLYMRARYYSPNILRFTSRDFLYGNSMQPQTLNRYTYVQGNPIRYIDPSGLGFFSSVWHAVTHPFSSISKFLISVAVVGVAGLAGMGLYYGFSGLGSLLSGGGGAPGGGGGPGGGDEPGGDGPGERDPFLTRKNLRRRIPHGEIEMQNLASLEDAGEGNPIEQNGLCQRFQNWRNGRFGDYHPHSY